MKVLVIQRLSDHALAILDRDPSIKYEVVESITDPMLPQMLSEADAITIRDAPLSAKHIASAPRLKVIARHGVGFDNIPIDICTASGIPVVTTGSANAVSVAEHTVCLLMCVARRSIMLDTSVRAGRFFDRNEIRGVELHSRTGLVVGFGRIGSEVAARLHHLGMHVEVFDPFLAADPEYGRRVDDFQGALSRSDVVSLHLPLNDQTRGIIGVREIALMPRDAIVLNTSRGGLVDETALLEAVREGRLFGAGLDTFAEEPLSADSPLLDEQRIVLSPHTAALTGESLRRMGELTIRNALDGLAGKFDPGLVANPDSLNPA